MRSTGTDRGPAAERPYLRFLWSHEAPLHRYLVRAANALLAPLPMRAKYAVGLRVRRSRAPYALVEPGDTVVQVGAPGDTLRAGRSRAFYFGRLVGPRGRVIAVEPDAASADALRRASVDYGHDNVTVVERAAWNGPTTLRIYVDDRHPASNFTAGTKQYDDGRMRGYRQVDVPASTLDEIVAGAHVRGPVKLVSITTNGAEREILAGMERLIAGGLRFVSVADTGALSEADLAARGYRLFSFDDRGRTFERVGPLPPPAS